MCNVRAAMDMADRASLHWRGIRRFEQKRAQGDGDCLGPNRVSLGVSPKGRGYHAVARLIRKHSRGSLTDQPSKHQLATFRKMKFNASIVTINARTTDPSTALRR